MRLGAKFGCRENGRVGLEDLAQFAKFVFSALPQSCSGVAGEGRAGLKRHALEAALGSAA